KNLVQPERTLGREASAPTRMRFLDASLGGHPSRAERRSWTATVVAAAARKERRARPATQAVARDPVACAIVCQDEAAHIAACLESATWCDELVVVDGGSREGTVALPRRLR